jgi:methylated-DNA-[protein]-cysteine S-methyltransferase
MSTIVLDISGQGVRPVRICLEQAAHAGQHERMMGTDADVTRFRHVDSPVGRIRLVGHDRALTGLYLADHHRCPPLQPGWAADEEAFDDVRQQLDEYFEGTRRDFEVAVELHGSDFQVAVWSALRTVPYGQTTSYSAIANAIGKPAAVRAVGAANGRNPISVIVPCHRVIGADGSLTGYGWGIDRKAWLLDHERDYSGSLFGPEAWSSPR